MAARIVCGQGLLELHLGEGGRADSRAFGEAEAGRLRDLTVTYRTHLRRRWGFESREAGAAAAGTSGTDLATIGAGLTAWLEGDGRGWLTRLLDDGPRPLVLGFECGRDADARGRALLEAPWELLHHPARGGYLMADPTAGFAPYRRQGQPASPAPPPPFRLGSLFMAASPAGQRELRFEEEENRLLKAAGGLAEIEVEDTGELDRLASRLGELASMQIVHLSCHGTDDRRITPAAPCLFLEDELGREQAASAAGLAAALEAGRPPLLFLSACLTAAGDATSPDPLAAALVAGGFLACLGWAGSVLDSEATRFCGRAVRPPRQRRSAGAGGGAGGTRPPHLQPALARLAPRPPLARRGRRRAAGRQGPEAAADDRRRRRGTRRCWIGAGAGRPSPRASSSSAAAAS